MKIGIVVISHGFGGAGGVIYNLCERLSKKHKIFLFLNNEILDFYKNLKNVRIISLGYFTNKNSLIKNFLLRKLAREIMDITQKEELSFLNCHMETSMMALKNFKNIIPVFHEREVDYFLKSNNLLNRFYFKPQITRVLNNAQKIISVSPHQIKDLSDKYRQKTIVISNGVNTNRFKPSKNVNQKKKVVLFAGRFIEIKGIKEILNVAKQLPQYEFWFAGKGELNGIIVGKNIKNLGFQTTEQLVRLYNQATICIFPSHWEAFGNVGLEAMACAKAVIATPLGFSEYIENGKDGIIIPEKDEDALKNAIMDLMTNEKKRKILEKNARKKALQYSWDNVAREYHQMCRDAIKKTKRKIKNEPTSN